MASAKSKNTKTTLAEPSPGIGALQLEAFLNIIQETLLYSTSKTANENDDKNIGHRIAKAGAAQYSSSMALLVLLPTLREPS